MEHNIQHARFNCCHRSLLILSRERQSLLGLQFVSSDACDSLEWTIARLRIRGNVAANSPTVRYSQCRAFVIDISRVSGMFDTSYCRVTSRHSTITTVA